MKTLITLLSFTMLMFFAQISNVSAISLAKSTTTEIVSKKEVAKKNNFFKEVKNIVNIILHPEALTSEKYNTLGIVAASAAFFGIFVLPILFEPAAIVMGIISLTQIKKTGEKGKGFAIGGIVAGALYLLLIVLIIGLFLASS